jgi:hypothetical protein
MIVTMFITMLSIITVGYNDLAYANNEVETEGRVRFETGDLRIDFASDIHFGRHEIINEDMTLYARPMLTSEAEIEQFVSVTDTRGTMQGWSLRVRQNGQLTSTTQTKRETLVDAELSIVGTFATRELTTTKNVSHPNPSEVPAVFEITLDASGETSSLIAQAGAGQGAQNWLMQFGVASGQGENTVNNNLRLYIPGTTPRDPVEYTTTLTWYIIHAPGN